MNIKRTVLLLLCALMGVAGASAQWKSSPTRMVYMATSQLSDLNAEDFGEGNSIEINYYDPDSNLGVMYFTKDLTVIGDGAFSGQTSLTSIDIPVTVTEFGSNPFEGCSSLVSVTINSQETLDAAGQSDVTGHFSSTFGNQVTNVILNGDFSSIPAGKFYGMTNLQSIAMPRYLQSICADAFSGCTSLASISIPDDVMEIVDGSFAGCASLTSVTIDGEESLKEVGSLVTTFGNQVTEVVLTGDITKIFHEQFSDMTNLQSVSIPSGVTNISSFAFSNCSSLTSVNLPATVSSIEYGAFRDCTSLASVTINSQATLDASIGENSSLIFVFGSQVTEFVLNGDITCIPDNTFGDMDNLTTVTIPEKVTSIGTMAFYDCVALTLINLKPMVPPSVGEDAFLDVNESATLHVPALMRAAYSAADGWESFSNIVEESSTLYDRDPFTVAVEQHGAAFSYVRTFSDAQVGKWQPLFVPFDIAVDAELLSKADIAKPYMVALEGAAGGGMNEDGGAAVVVLKKLENGETAMHGTAYFIRPKAAGEFSLIYDNATLYSCTDVTTLTCSTTEDNYAFVGQYTSGKPSSGTWYALGGGQFHMGGSESAALDAQRWYMTKESKDGAQHMPFRAINVMTWGEDEAVTAIIGSKADTGDSGIWSPAGVRLAEPQKGLNIIGGKKVFMK